MGMGEPLDNLDNVLKVIEILTAPWGLAWSPKRITVSTVGVKNALKVLCEILPNEHVRVNLIRYHMIPGAAKLRTSSDERMAYFRDYLNSKGITCTIRRSRGEDISAACGMLAGKVKDAEKDEDKKNKKKSQQQ